MIEPLHTLGRGRITDLVWSPDGARVAFVSQENKSDDIWVINADGTKPRNLTPNSWQWDKHPSWSPDSRRIVFWSNREGRRAKLRPLTD